MSRVLNRDLFGFYVVTEGEIARNATSFEHEAFFPQVSRGAFQGEPDTVIYEALFSETGPSTSGWSENGTVMFQEGTEQDPQSATTVRNIQDGALDFIRDVDRLFGKTLLRNSINPRAANHVLSEFWNVASDKGVLDAISHEDTLFHDARKPLSAFYAPEVADDIFSVYDGGELTHRTSKRKRLMIYCPAMTRIPGGVEG